MTDNMIIENDDIIDDKPLIASDKTCYDTNNNIKIYDCNLSEDNTFITGYTEEGKKAKYIFDRGKWYYGNEISKLNLIDIMSLPAERRKEIQSAGGKKSQEQIQHKRTLNDVARVMLDKVMSSKQIDEVLGDAKTIAVDDTVGSVMMAKMVQTALAGSFKAAEFVRDTAGYKPKNEISADIQANLMTDADRSLMEKLDRRLTG